MDKNLLSFLRDRTEMSRLQTTEIEEIFKRLEADGWHVVRAGALATDEMRAAIEQAAAKKEAIAHNMKAEQDKPVIPAKPAVSPTPTPPTPSFNPMGSSIGQRPMEPSFMTPKPIGRDPVVPEPHPASPHGTAAAFEGGDVPDEDEVK